MSAGNSEAEARVRVVAAIDRLVDARDYLPVGEQRRAVHHAILAATIAAEKLGVRR